MSYDPRENARLAVELGVSSLEDFAAVEEDGAGAIVGEAGAALIPEGSDVMLYGDGGVGKTTLCIDLACHLAAGDDWLGIEVPQTRRVLIVENEGPRALFRVKLRRKLQGWRGSPLEGRVFVLEEPWARLSLDDGPDRAALAGRLRQYEIDICIVGPVTASGMEQAGTLQDVRAFADLLADVRLTSGRRVAFLLVHHENKGGKVSGAWEGCGDTLLHVQGQGHGRTRLYVQKARWASSRHATALNLVWTEGEGFAVDEEPELDDDAIAELILAAVRDHPGAGWTRIEEATLGVRAERRRQVRDGLLTARRIVNVVKNDGIEVALDYCPERRPARLYAAGDPFLEHLRPAPDADGTQAASAQGALVESASASCVPPYKGRRTWDADADGHPALLSEDDFPDLLDAHALLVRGVAE